MASSWWSVAVSSLCLSAIRWNEEILFRNIDYATTFG
jgi:hypothetical protein